jgi:hypothetical protein
MMSFSLSGGVEVLGFISPTDPLDTYPVIDPIYGIDGFRNVDLISDLDLIPNPRRRAGMVVGISGGTQYYKLNPSPWNGDITDWSVFNTELTGNYLPLSGGSVTGNTTITGAFRVTGNTITYGNLTGLGPSSTYIATPLTINPGDYSRFIQSYYFKLHPEGSNSFIPYFINDIGYLTLRGGSVTSNFSGLTQTQIETIFDGTPRYATFNPSLLGTGMTLNISFGQTFNFTNILVISFGAANWRSQDFTVELSSGGTYSTLDVVTGFTESDYSIKFSLPSPNSFDGVRVTFSNFFNPSSPTGFRIADISLLAFNSNGPKSLYVGRDGGDIYKQLYVTGATETRPSYSTLNDIDSGMYFPSANTIGFSTNGSEKVRIDSTGNVGIGTVNPITKLHVSGNTVISNGLTATTISATTYQNLPTDVNIYNTNGTLTGARSVNLSGNQLTFSSSTTGTNVIGLYGSGNTSTSRTYFEMGQRNNGGFSSSVFFTSFAPNYSDTSWGSFYSGSSMLSAYHENPVTTGGFGNLFFDISQFGSTVANRYFAWHAAPVTTARSLSTEMMRLHILGNGDGNLGINTKGVPTQKLHVSGNTLIEGSLSARTATISGNSQNILSVIGSGNSTTSPLFTVQGSSGELFSVSDSLVGSLFSVNDISGLPIVEVFSDNTMLVGSYQSPALNTTVRKTLTGGTNTIYSIPTSAYTGAFFDYTLISSGSTGARAGTIMTIWSGSTAQFTETPTPSIGSTTGVTFSVAVSGSNAVLSSSATTAGWVVKTIVRSI